ncbi:MAG: hypothetical protein HY367_03725 [Candidatus Aenigmarchaeota archaeon]|nr:hypothetical protein [Candidatus Aenigmarchaeota archaeon]
MGRQNGLVGRTDECVYTICGRFGVMRVRMCTMVDSCNCTDPFCAAQCNQQIMRASAATA